MAFRWCCRSLAWATGAFIAADAVPFAEAAEIECVDPQAECYEMRPHVASVVGLAEMPEHVNQRVQLPPVGIAEGGAQAGIQPRQQFHSVAEFCEPVRLIRDCRSGIKGGGTNWSLFSERNHVFGPLSAAEATISVATNRVKSLMSCRTEAFSNAAM